MDCKKDFILKIECHAAVPVLSGLYILQYMSMVFCDVKIHMDSRICGLLYVCQKAVFLGISLSSKSSDILLLLFNCII